VLSWTPTSDRSRSTQYIVPSWSADGTFISSGSIDPRIHVWDVRYSKAHEPAQTLDMHKKRVLCAEFHPKKNKLITLSSDKNIGFHVFTV